VASRPLGLLEVKIILDMPKHVCRRHKQLTSSPLLIKYSAIAVAAMGQCIANL
jgi:hypothetical protein